MRRSAAALCSGVVAPWRSAAALWRAAPLPPHCANDTETACFTGVYRTLLGGRVEGVLTCPLELDGIGCATSDADGVWQIPGLPLDSNVLFTATHAEYVPVLYPQHTSMDWYDWYKTAVPPWVMESNADRLGASLQADRGHLLFIAWEGLNIDGSAPAFDRFSRSRRKTTKQSLLQLTPLGERELAHYSAPVLAWYI